MCADGWNLSTRDSPKFPVKLSFAEGYIRLVRRSLTTLDVLTKEALINVTGFSGWATEVAGLPMSAENTNIAPSSTGFNADSSIYTAIT